MDQEGRGVVVPLSNTSRMCYLVQATHYPDNTDALIVVIRETSIVTTILLNVDLVGVL